MCSVRELIDDVVPERPRLENAPLKAVVCQARFPRQLSLGDDEVRPIQRALGHRYPMAAEERSGGAGRRILRFGDTDGGWIATISPEAISLETTAYVGMKDLLIRWSELASAAAEAFELTVQTRLGLRYINELECPGSRREDLSGWVRNELLVPLAARPEADDLLRFVSQAQFRQPDGSSCNMRHGIAPRESEEGGMVFLLDLDCFVGEAAEFDPVGQIRSLARLNESAYGIFNWAFADRILERFGPTCRGGGESKAGWVKHAKESNDASRKQCVFAADSLWFDYTATFRENLGRSGRFELEVDRSHFFLARSGDADDPAPVLAAEPLSAVLESIRESIDIPVADLARMVGLRRRQFYNLLAGSPTGTETEMRIRRLAAALDRLAVATEGGPRALRAAVLTPIGPDATNLFEVAIGGDEKLLATTVEALLVQIETRGVRRTRRAIPRPVPAGTTEQRRRLMRESLADRPARKPTRERDADDGK